MGTTYLLDTSAVSKYIRGKLPATSLDLIDAALVSPLQLSVIVEIELLSWVTGDKELDNDIRKFISQAILINLSDDIVQQTIKLRRHYKGLKLPDAVIAATAIVHSFTLLSTNGVDFQRINELNYKSLSA